MFTILPKMQNITIYTFETCFVESRKLTMKFAGRFIELLGQQIYGGPVTERFKVRPSHREFPQEDQF